MAFKPSQLLPWLTLLIGYFRTVAADYCTFRDIWGSRTEYCYYGCCDDECCSSRVGVIVGICVGVGILIFVIAIVTICICRRRRTRGIVYQNQMAPPLVVHSTTHGGMISTAGVQPGVTYNQYQPYGPYPNAPPTSQAGFQGYPPQPQPYGNYAPPPVSGGYAAPPPAYDSVTSQAAGGVPNSGFDSK